MLFGWTFAQWAHARAHYARVVGSAVPATVHGAVSLRKWWLSRRPDNPGEVRIYGIEPEHDFAWASELFATSALVY